jgi:2-hydroxychromene-2-carboxylate isomerase
MAKAVEFLFDFGSPNAYLAWAVLPGIAARHGAQIEILPCLLGGLFKLTNNQAPMLAFAGIKGKMASEMAETRRFIRRHGIDRFAMNPHFPVNTVLIMRGLVAARRAAVGEAYMAAVLKAMWEDGKAMADPAVVAEVLTGAGLDAAAILAATQDQAVKDELIERTQAAADRGAFGIPTFWVGDEMFFGKNTLWEVEEAFGRN